MKRWTNGLPGATKRLGAKMALRGLAASQPRMRADTHDGPEQIAPLQRPDPLMQLSRSLISEVHLVPHGRAIHFGTRRTCRDVSHLSAFWRDADMLRGSQAFRSDANDPKRTKTGNAARCFVSLCDPPHSQLATSTVTSNIAKAALAGRAQLVGQRSSESLRKPCGSDRCSGGCLNG